MRDQRASPAGLPVARRTVLLGGLAVLGGAAVGGLAALQHERGTGAAEPPVELIDARQAEQTLIDSIDASSGHDPNLRAGLAAIRADHQAHLAALDAAIGRYAAVAPATARGAAPIGRAALRVAEQRAAVRAAQTAAALAGRDAVLLASIAACEASHAELLR